MVDDIKNKYVQIENVCSVWFTADPGGLSLSPAILVEICRGRGKHTGRWYGQDKDRESTRRRTRKYEEKDKKVGGEGQEKVRGEGQESTSRRTIKYEEERKSTRRRTGKYEEKDRRKYEEKDRKVRGEGQEKVRGEG